nr:PREDICTED: uncharacterized protein LOC106483290 [Apteryx mantelli mantelli]
MSSVTFPWGRAAAQVRAVLCVGLVVADIFLRAAPWAWRLALVLPFSTNSCLKLLLIQRGPLLPEHRFPQERQLLHYSGCAVSEPALANLFPETKACCISLELPSVTLQSVCPTELLPCAGLCPARAGRPRAEQAGVLLSSAAAVCPSLPPSLLSRPAPARPLPSRLPLQPGGAPRPRETGVSTGRRAALARGTSARGHTRLSPQWDAPVSRPGPFPDGWMDGWMSVVPARPRLRHSGPGAAGGLRRRRLAEQQLGCIETRAAGQFLKQCWFMYFESLHYCI